MAGRLPGAALALAVLALATAASGCAGSRPAVPDGVVFCVEITDANAFGLRVVVTRVSDQGAAGLTLGGRATDAETGDPIPGLNVAVGDGRRGAATDLDGRFVLDSLRADQTLRFSFVGYRTLEARVGSLAEGGEVAPDRPAGR